MNGKQNKQDFSLTPEDKMLNAKKASVRSEKLPSIQPMSSVQFKEMLNKRRSLVIDDR